MDTTTFHELIQKCITTHNKKNHDYAKEDNPHSNFEIVAELVKHFKNPIDQVYVTLIGVKLARMSELLNGKEPNNESIEDTYVDLTNYSALWGAHWLDKDSTIRRSPSLTANIIGLIDNEVQSLGLPQKGTMGEIEISKNRIKGVDGLNLSYIDIPTKINDQGIKIILCPVCAMPIASIPGLIFHSRERHDAVINAYNNLIFNNGKFCYTNSIPVNEVGQPK